VLLNDIETHMGRTRLVPLGPRAIDLDILLFGETVLDTPSLTIPHPELHRRRFALAPCTEIDASLMHPLYKQPLSSFLTHIDPSQGLSLAVRAADVLSLILPEGMEGQSN
jgi:2-amino-4-hydroxy-6-hydroxymethyldihydropteridine diphosphokinase